MFNIKKLVSGIISMSIVLALSSVVFGYGTINVRLGNLSTYKTETIEAMQSWNASFYTKNYVRFAWTDTNTKLLVDNFTVFNFVDDSSMSWMGKAISGDIKINNYYANGPTKRKIVILHELGHIMGLPHHSNSQAIMHKELSLDSAVYLTTNEDISFIQTKYAKLYGTTNKGSIIASYSCEDGPAKLGGR